MKNRYEFRRNLIHQYNAVSVSISIKLSKRTTIRRKSSNTSIFDCNNLHFWKKAERTFATGHVGITCGHNLNLFESEKGNIQVLLDFQNLLKVEC